MRITLVQPDPLGRISGGYLYNQELARACERMSLASVPEGQLTEFLATLHPAAEDWILADSLFLNESGLAPFFELRRRYSCHLGLLLHALPSFVRYAQAWSDAGPASFTPDPAELELLARLNLVLCPGAYLPRVFAEHGARVNCLPCPPGAPPAGLAAEGSAEVGVLSVSNVTRGKGLDDGVRALAKLVDLPWHWQIVGSLEWEPSFVAELRDAVTAHGLSQRVEFSGQLDHESTLQIYGRNQVLLLPSRSENHPLVILEAQAAGLPTVAYDVGGVPDLVAHGKSGLLAPAYDIDVLASHLGRLIEDASLRRSLGAQAHASAVKRPGWQQVAAELTRQLSGHAGVSLPRR